jgi:AcrR family transcriptional regulator
MGLRERKKAKTQAAILHAALHLFRERGYEHATIEQIAEAAEVSKTTFFRYFRTKDDVVLHDPYDAPFLERLRAQPKELGPIEALRATMREFRAQVPDREIAEDWQRLEVIIAVPELHARLLDQFASSMGELLEIFAEHTGRSAQDLDVLTFAGAVMGAMLTVWLHDGQAPVTDRIARIEEVLERLQEGLPLA